MLPFSRYDIVGFSQSTLIELFKDHTTIALPFGTTTAWVKLTFMFWRADWKSSLGTDWLQYGVNGPGSEHEVGSVNLDMMY